MHLWTPEKIYYADLGLRGENGSFVALARSNTVRTPPAIPVTQTFVSEPALPEPEGVEEVSEAPAAQPEPVAQPEPMPAVVEPIVPEPRVVESAAARVDAAAILRRKLEELFEIRC